MEHTNEKQNGDQQPDVEKIEYYVDCDLVYDYDSEEHFYKLITKNEEAKIKFFLIKVDNIVLSPGLSILFSGDILEGSVLDISIFDEYSYSGFAEVIDKGIIYKSDNFEILFPEEVKELNNTFSGKVVSKSDSNALLNNQYNFYEKQNYDIYEVKLDENININSICRSFKNIYISSQDLLIGSTVNGLKINPLSLFNKNNDTNYSKPVLYSYFYDKKDILSKDDLLLYKKQNLFDWFNEAVYGFMFYVFIVVIFLNFITTSSLFLFDWGLLIVLFFPLSLMGFQFYKTKESYYYIDEIKNNKFWNIIRTTFGIVIFTSLLFLYSSSYSYDSKYIYDTKTKVLLNSNRFFVAPSLVFRKDKILERYVPVENKYMIDLIYQIPGSLISFSNKYIDLEINITFKKGDFLLGNNLKNSLFVIRNSMQERVSSGYYGNLSSMNTYDYRKTIINIEEDIMNLISLSINEEDSAVEDIKITTKYAKLHNIEN